MIWGTSIAITSKSLGQPRTRNLLPYRQGSFLQEKQRKVSSNIVERRAGLTLISKVSNDDQEQTIPAAVARGPAFEEDGGQEGRKDRSLGGGEACEDCK